MKKETEWEARKRCGEKPFEKEKWEKEFDSRFTDNGKVIQFVNWTPNEIKSFIRRLLKEKDSIIADLEEEIEKLERREP